MSYENNPTLRVSYALGVNWQDPNCKQTEAALPVIYERMKEQLSEKYRDQIISLREITAHREEAKSDNQLDLAKELKAKADQIKKDLPMFTPSGTFPEKTGQRTIFYPIQEELLLISILRKTAICCHHGWRS